jgi:hypothetical protein
LVFLLSNLRCTDPWIQICKAEISDKTQRQASWPSSQNLTQWTLFPLYSYFPKSQLVSNMVFCLPVELIPWTWCLTRVKVPILKFIIKANVHVSFSTAHMISKWMWSCLYHQHALYVTNHSSFVSVTFMHVCININPLRLLAKILVSDMQRTQKCFISMWQK